MRAVRILLECILVINLFLFSGERHLFSEASEESQFKRKSRGPDSPAKQISPKGKRSRDGTPDKGYSKQKGTRIELTSEYTSLLAMIALSAVHHLHGHLFIMLFCPLTPPSMYNNTSRLIF